jgi:transposase
VLGKRPKARVLIEASTESEWVARYLEELGHEVIVADPNFAPMYATRSKRVKTIDVRVNDHPFREMKPNKKGRL